MSKYHSLSRTPALDVDSCLHRHACMLPPTRNFASLPACLQAAEAAVMGLSVSSGELKTETVEEFISISDGQVREARRAACVE